MFMNTQEILGLVIIIACFGIAFYYWATKVRKERSKKEALAFLDGLSETIYKEMIEIIKDFDMSKYTSLTDLETDLINDIYDKIYIYIKSVIDYNIEKNGETIISALALKVLDKQFIIDFIEKCIIRNNIHDEISSRFLSRNIEEKSDNMIKNDESLQDEFSDDAKYVTVEDDKVVESIIEDHLDTIDEIAKKLAENPSTLTIEEREDLEKKLEALKALKPQKDIDEDEYDPNTMEPLE